MLSDGSLSQAKAKRGYDVRKLMVAGLLAAALGLGLFVAGAPGGSSKKSCLGTTPTIVGTQGADVINGTPGADVIAARAGNDQVWGHGGGDLICGGSGKDTLQGGDGTDMLAGEQGADLVDGGVLGCCGPGNTGDDVVQGGQ